MLYTMITQNTILFSRQKQYFDFVEIEYKHLGQFSIYERAKNNRLYSHPAPPSIYMIDQVQEKW